MGRCETAKASVGIKIQLCDLISQISETNFAKIKTILEDGFLEDENEELNHTYHTIVYDVNLPDNYLEYKMYLEEKIEEECLSTNTLLYPIKDILVTERWGYDRSGTNGLSRDMDFDLSMDTEPYQEIEKISIVFILRQYSG